MSCQDFPPNKTGTLMRGSQQPTHAPVLSGPTGDAVTRTSRGHERPQAFFKQPAARIPELAPTCLMPRAPVQACGAPPSRRATAAAWRACTTTTRGTAHATLLIRPTTYWMP